MSLVGPEKSMFFILMANSENDATIELISTKGKSSLYAKSCGNKSTCTFELNETDIMKSTQLEGKQQQQLNITATLLQSNYVIGVFNNEKTVS